MVVNPTIQAIYCIEIEPLLIVQEVGGGLGTAWIISEDLPPPGFESGQPLP